MPGSDTRIQSGVQQHEPAITLALGNVVSEQAGEPWTYGKTLTDFVRSSPSATTLYTLEEFNSCMITWLHIFTLMFPHPTALQIIKYCLAIPKANSLCAQSTSQCIKVSWSLLDLEKLAFLKCPTLTQTMTPSYAQWTAHDPNCTFETDLNWDLSKT